MCKKFKNNGNIEIVAGYKKKTDHKDLISISRFFAQKGDNVKITTDIHFKDEKYKEVFGALIGTKYERKCIKKTVGSNLYSPCRWPSRSTAVFHCKDKGYYLHNTYFC